MFDSDERYERRTVLRGVGASLLGVGLAGCGGPGAGEDGEEGGEEEEGGDRLGEPDAPRLNGRGT